MVIRDGFPISPGHTLIIPRRHIGSFFELSPGERDSLLTLMETPAATQTPPLMAA